MVIAFGTGLFGKVDQVPGRCHVATRFVYFCGVPVVPLSSWAVVDDGRLVSGAFVAELVTASVIGVSPSGEGEPICGVRVPFNWRSVLVSYLRGPLFVVHGIGTFFLLFLGGMTLYLHPLNGKHPPYDALAVLAACSVGGGVGLWLSYRLTRPTAVRAAELEQLLGLPPV